MIELYSVSNFLHCFSIIRTFAHISLVHCMRSVYKRNIAERYIFMRSYFNTDS